MPDLSKNINAASLTPKFRPDAFEVTPAARNALLAHFKPIKPDLASWLDQHPLVRDSIKWQFTGALSAYTVDESSKRPWILWSLGEKKELLQAFDEAWAWYFGGSDPLQNNGPEVGVQYPPFNLHPTINDDMAPPAVLVKASYARDLYLRWVAHHLLVETGRLAPWSLLESTAEQLEILFDSAALMRMNLDESHFCLGTDAPWQPNYVKRRDNLGTSLIGLPRYTFQFLKINQLIGPTRLATIYNLLAWCTKHMGHFSGKINYGSMYATWQYRGLPPFNLIVKGTVYNDPVNGALLESWTAGCHGTFGFLRHALRAVNIPVEGVRIGGHAVVHFLTEGKYMDHGDNPYNAKYQASGLPPSALLIDEATFLKNFGPNPDNNDDHPEYVEKTVKNLP
jgi:hypothetical protein